MEERQKTLFAQRVAELRKERGETQAEFSQRTGVRQQTFFQECLTEKEGCDITIKRFKNRHRGIVQWQNSGLQNHR